MEISIKAKVGRPKTEKPIDDVESIPVSSEMKEKIRSLKYRGLKLNDMTRDFFEEVIREAEAGRIEGISSGKSAS